MIQGGIIVNGCMRTQKFEEITQMYVEAARRQGVHLTVCYNNTWVYGPDGLYAGKQQDRMKEWAFVLFLDKDIRLAKLFERQGIRVFNTAQVIETCDDKAQTFIVLSGKGVPMPKTLIAPLVYSGMYQHEQDTYLTCIEDELDYPVVIKECFGSFGMQVYKADNREELQVIRAKVADKPHLYQAFVASSCGRDVRVHVVGDKVVCAMKRTSQTDFRANITNGGQMEAFDCPETFTALALKISHVLKADFLGIDLLFGEHDEPILCEVNSNAHIKNIFECTGVNVAEHIMGYIKQEVMKHA